MPRREITIEDPRSRDVRALLQRHLAFARSHSLPKDAHALDIDGLLDPAVAFFGLRFDGALLAVGALKKLDENHAEVKSMQPLKPAGAGGSVARCSIICSASPTTADSVG